MLTSNTKFKTILLTQDGTKATIILNRPEYNNCINTDMADELSVARELINQEESIRVVIISGQSNIFSKGSDISTLTSPNKLYRYQAASHIANIQKPVVASISGYAIGQGLELALAADIRIATKKSYFAMPQIHDGLLPWDGGTQRLPRIIGRSHALSMILTGDVLTAEEALRIGLINHLVPQKNIYQAINSITDQIESAAPIATQYLKEAIMNGLNMTLKQGLRLEADLNFLLHTTKDRSEGISSFLDHRIPKFDGE